MENPEYPKHLDDDQSILSEQQIAKMSEVHTFSDAQLDNLKILHQGMANEKVLNVFRELRTQVYERAREQNFVCMVTAVCPGGGASYTASNLAAAISLDRAKTSVLVDANVYAPSTEPLLSADANLGLTDYLALREMGIEFILYASGIKRLRIVPAGKNTSGATEKFSSSKMKMFLHELKGRYADRYIVIDAPSVGEFSADVRILAELSDFVVLVVPYGKVTDADVRRSIDIIGEQRVAGVIFNRA